MMADVDSLESNALMRKERLKALKAKRQQRPDDGDDPENDRLDEVEKLPGPVFRSYRPLSDQLKENAMEATKPADVTEKIQEQIEAGKTKHIIEEVDLVNLAPRKPDWDLKRDIAKKLEKLEKRTQRAITELIRERLKASQGDLATAVAASEAVNQAEDED